ncbi:MAG: hypothetical protein ABL907_00425 [Hyphomicrobium sp.]
MADIPPSLSNAPRQDFAEGVTCGMPWNWHDSLVAQLVVDGEGRRRSGEQDLATAMRVVSAMGLLEFNIRFLQVWCSHWWWGDMDEANT